MQRTKSNAQFLIDIAFGFLIISPLIYGMITADHLHMVVYFTAGACSAYCLHVIQKMLVFNELLRAEVRDEAEERVEEEVENVDVGEEAVRHVEQELEEQI